MIPVIIPSPGGACFAAYEAANGPAVLICPPFGDEALKTARVWRDLSVRLAMHDVATLRFDLPGTGNSSGAPTDPDRVGAWRGAVQACAEWLARRHGGRVILFGHRFGALLALDAVASGVDAEQLILLDPPASGVAQARYLRARARLERAGPAPEGPDYIQVGGVPLAAATLDALASLPTPPSGDGFPPSMLVLDERSAASSPWPQTLREHGSAVEVLPFHGHAEFVPHDVFRARPPAAVLDHVVDRIARTVGVARPSRLLYWPQPAALQLDGVTETPIQFGAAGEMFGILCRPTTPDATRSALLLPTTGADPCAGMARMWTDLARRVARLGVTSLRFDMRGVGESGGDLGTDRLSSIYHPDRVDDLKRAVDALAERGFDDVTVVGYCAGAYAAWQAAIPDPRIAAVLAGNLLYLNQQTSLAPEVLSERPGASRIGVAGGGMGRLVPPRSLAALRRLDNGTRRLVPRRLRMMLRSWGSDPQQTRRHVKALVSRGCSVSLVMARDDHGHIRLRHAFGEEPRLPDGVELTVIPDADHQFSDRRHRARFLDLAAEFAVRPAPRLPATEVSPIEPRRLESA